MTYTGLQEGGWGRDDDGREFCIAEIRQNHVITSSGRIVWKLNVTPIDPPALAEGYVPAYDEVDRICSDCGSDACDGCDL